MPAKTFRNIFLYAHGQKAMYAHLKSNCLVIMEGQHLYKIYIQEAIDRKLYICPECMGEILNNNV